MEYETSTDESSKETPSLSSFGSVALSISDHRVKEKTQAASNNKRNANDMQKESSPHVLIMNDKEGVLDQDLINRRVIHGLDDKSTKLVWLEKGQVNLDEAIEYYRKQGYTIFNIDSWYGDVLTTRYDFESKQEYRLEHLSFESEIQLKHDTRDIDEAMNEMESDIQEGGEHLKHGLDHVAMNDL